MGKKLLDIMRNKIKFNHYSIRHLAIHLQTYLTKSK